MGISRLMRLAAVAGLLASLAAPGVVLADDEEDFYKAMREKQRREKAIKEGKDPDAKPEPTKAAEPEPPKLPETASGWIATIKRLWDSEKPEEVKLVDDAVERLVVAIGGDATLRAKVSKTFEGYKEKEGAKLAAASLKDIKATRDSLRRVLVENRPLALKAIMDPRYTEADDCKLQPEVDKACKPLFDVWNDAVGYLIEKKRADLSRPAARLDRLAALLARIDEPLGRWEEGVSDGNAFLRQACSALIDIKKEEYEANKGVLSANEAIADADCDAESKSHVRVLNDYRMMLGRGALAINLALYKAATSHSKYQEKIGRIGHDIPGHPDGVTPQQRCKRAGYGGSVGENCLMGSRTGAEAVWQWYRAAEHHRAMIGNWVHIGAGHSGVYWTQNFGGGAGGRGN
ncbi:MAG: CAP domain-containing protein [Planctomycetaceae bacterium]|nr:hypothetical protein [Planctomycetota bacterium]MCQ3951035.1 hypothetical protein [Planctomycetota bacterium]NUO16739.1 CAP domain-containing protein [Planctomycetaceae bacterium]GIK51265.1 MAG: hypothetical protein BroJett014_02380 [Planctomycetota bacterium]HRJ78682.1 CAP domain-containing protein [Planctomycetota bacterium]